MSRALPRTSAYSLQEKINHKLFHCVLETAFTGVFPAFHMELVKVSVPSTLNQGRRKQTGRERRGGARCHIQQDGRLHGGRPGRGGGGGRAVVSGYKNIELGSAKKCTVNTVPCKICLACPQLLEERFGRMWSSDLGGQLNIFKSQIKASGFNQKLNGTSSCSNAADEKKRVWYAAIRTNVSTA